MVQERSGLICGGRPRRIASAAPDKLALSRLLGHDMGCWHQQGQRTDGKSAAAPAGQSHAPRCRLHVPAPQPAGQGLLALCDTCSATEPSAVRLTCLQRPVPGPSRRGEQDSQRVTLASAPSRVHTSCRKCPCTFVPQLCMLPALCLCQDRSLRASRREARWQLWHLPEREARGAPAGVRGTHPSWSIPRCSAHDWSTSLSTVVQPSTELHSLQWAC